MILLAGIAIFINFLLLLEKLKKREYVSFFADLVALFITTMMFSGTYSGMAAGYIGNMFFSIYLLYKPLRIDDIFNEDEDNNNEFKL